MALAQLDRPSAARAALEHSVQIEPALAPAWFRLGVVYLRLGQKELARTVLARLESMSADLAAQLARLIEPG
jgi:hypothetical protein